MKQILLDVNICTQILYNSWANSMMGHVYLWPGYVLKLRYIIVHVLSNKNATDYAIVQNKYQQIFVVDVKGQASNQSITWKQIESSKADADMDSLEKNINKKTQSKVHTIQTTLNTSLI